MLLLFDEVLLFFHGVEQNDGDAVILDALDLAFVVVGDKQRFDFGDFFGNEA